MSDVVECPEHGEQPMTFVCQHLAGSLQTGEKIGFFHSGTEERSDAWCAACDEVRIREDAEGDWNEVSEAFAGITLLCGRCYDKVQETQKS